MQTSTTGGQDTTVSLTTVWFLAACNNGILARKQNQWEPASQLMGYSVRNQKVF